ncbi:MAG TPA: hypothetical protein VIF60_24060 [Burkholderiaceae bacterium]
MRQRIRSVLLWVREIELQEFKVGYDTFPGTGKLRRKRHQEEADRDQPCN